MPLQADAAPFIPAATPPPSSDKCAKIEGVITRLAEITGARTKESNASSCEREAMDLLYTCWLLLRQGPCSKITDEVSVRAAESLSLMAQTSLLQCCACLQRVCAPVTLPCGHSVCSSCRPRVKSCTVSSCFLYCYALNSNEYCKPNVSFQKLDALLKFSSEDPTSSSMSPLDADGNVLEFVKSIQAGQPERAFILACCSSELSAHLPLRFPLLSQHAAAAFIHLVASDAPAAAVLQQELPSEAELFATSVSKLKGIAALRNISTVGIVDKMDLVRAILDASLQAASAPSHFLPTPLTLVTSILPCLPPPSELLSAISRAIAKVSSMSWPYGLLPPAPPLPDFSILSRDMSESLADALECSLCCDVLYRPCATSCGHCFCRQCLHRAMDHNLVCPLCRADVSQLIVLASRQFNSGNQAWGFPLTVDLAEIISRVFPEAAMMRAQEIETEASHDGLPLFVCNSCLPGQVVSLHIFEPRYRLMMRRALMLDRRFGMAAHTHQGPAQFGCVLRIDHAEMLPGGRMLIECMAEGVFQTTGLSVRDGYYVATVDMQHDAPTDYLNLARDEDASATLERNAAAAVQVLWNFVQFLQRHPDFGPVFVSTYGAYPEDVSQLAYKVALFMRFNDEEMQELLSCRHADLRALIVYTARERLFRSAMRQDVDNAERVRRRARMPSPSPPPDDRADDAQDE